MKRFGRTHDLEIKMTPDELQQVGEILREAGRDELLPRFMASHTLVTRQKTSAFDIVTEADEQCEAAIQRGLRERFPEVLFIGEELAEKSAGWLDALSNASAAFIVDPLDGTKNFAAGLPLFGIMAAYVERGIVMASAIHDPIRGDTAFALRDQGAWMQDPHGARVPLHVAAPVEVASMEAIAGTAFLPEPLRSRVRANLDRLAMYTWLRCAAHEYRMAAAGHVHLLSYNRLMPWDHAAGWLLHREAGGFSAHFDGSEYLPSHTSGGLLCAPDKASWLAARNALLD